VLIAVAFFQDGHRSYGYRGVMATHNKINFSEVKDSAPEYGMDEVGEARFARGDLGAERIGLARYHLRPSMRLGFGHAHGESEEVYVVLSGSGRFRVGDDVFPVGPDDIVYCPPEAMREWEAGAEGMVMLAFGAHTEGEQHEFTRDFWTD
jgi:mannose-6-phosphate isomerase-like protein (cupin superfamily)